MKERSRTEYSILNIVSGFAGYGINAVIGFVCRIIFVRTLTVDYLGVSGLFSNVLSVLSLAELGIASAIIYALYKPIAEKDEEKIASIMQFYRKAYRVIGMVVAAVGLLMLPLLQYIIVNPPDIKENLYLIYLLYLTNAVVSYFFSYRASLMTAMQRQYIVSGYNYVITISQSLVQIVFLLLTKEYITYLLIQFVGSIVYNVWVSAKTAKDYPYIKNKAAKPLPREETRVLWRNVKALSINKISGILVNSTDNIAITYFSGIGSVGYASNYVILNTMLDSIVGMFFGSLTGSVGNLNATTDDEGRYRFFKVFNLANFWMYGWAAIGMTFVSTDMVSLFYGSQYALPLHIPLILAVNMYTIGMLYASYVYKSTLGLFRYGQYLLFFTGIINLILDVILGRMLGMFGIYLATLIARMSTNLWYEPYAVFRYGLKKRVVLFWIRYIRFGIVLLIAGGICAGCCYFCHFSIVINILVKICICTAVPNLVFWLFFGRTEEFDYLKGKIIQILKMVFRKK